MTCPQCNKLIGAEMKDRTIVSMKGDIVEDFCSDCQAEFVKNEGDEIAAAKNKDQP